jgi:aspartyl/asparaginyl-tRNA synthetase
MKEFYAVKAKKNKRVRQIADLFEKEIDQEIMTMIIREYLINVLWRTF